jgi:hypothetical protein
MRADQRTNAYLNSREVLQMVWTLDSMLSPKCNCKGMTSFAFNCRREDVVFDWFQRVVQGINFFDRLHFRQWDHSTKQTLRVCLVLMELIEKVFLF